MCSRGSRRSCSRSCCEPGSLTGARRSTVAGCPAPSPALPPPRSRRPPPSSRDDSHRCHRPHGCHRRRCTAAGSRSHAQGRSGNLPDCCSCSSPPHHPLDSPLGCSSLCSTPRSPACCTPPRCSPAGCTTSAPLPRGTSREPAACQRVDRARTCWAACLESSTAYLVSSRAPRRSCNLRQTCNPRPHRTCNLGKKYL